MVSSSSTTITSPSCSLQASCVGGVQQELARGSLPAHALVHMVAVQEGSFQKKSCKTPVVKQRQSVVAQQLLL